MKNRVVITGIGPVTQLGIGKDEFIKNLLSGKRKFSQKIPEDTKEKYPVNVDYYVLAVKLTNEQTDRKIKLFSNINSQVVALASKLAIEDSGITIPEDNEILAILGLGVGDLSSGFKNYEKFITEGKMDRFGAPKVMANAPASWISITNHLHGECYVINAACASSTNAIGEAYLKIADGHADTVVCGGTEWLQDDKFSIIKLLEGLKVFDSSPDGLPRPFQETRSGLLLNEGTACCLVLENYETAKKRGAEIYAEVTGFAASMDAYSIVAIEESGAVIEKMLRKLTSGKRIDYYNAHGTGTILNDKVESEVFKRIFGEDVKNQPMINSTKGLLGHTFGASGAIEAMVCAIAIKYGIVHPNLIDHPIENLNLVSEVKTNQEVNTAISASFGFGGHNAALLFEKVEGKNE